MKTHKTFPTHSSLAAGLTALAALLIQFAAAPLAHAADGTWTQLTTGGLWSNTANWSAGAVADGSGFTANFSTLNITAANTVKMDASHTLTALSFADITTPFVGWTLDNNGVAGNILTLAGTTPSITVGASSTATISAVIDGTTAWSKAGAGTLILSGANTYTGATTNSLGTLSVNTFPNGGVAGSLGMSSAASANLNVNGGTLSYSGVNATTDRGLTLNGNGILTVASSTANLNLAGILAGGIFSMTKGGPGILTLSGANTWTGNTFVSGGTLAINSIKNVGGVANSLGMPALANATIAIGTGPTTTTLSYIGAGDTSDRVINLPGTSGGAILDQSGASGLLKFTSPLTASGLGSKTLTLQGSAAGTGEIGAAIVNNSTTGSTAITATFANAAVTAVLASVDGVSVGATISGTGIAGSLISAINTATRTVTFSPAATAASSAVGTTYTVTGVQNRTSLTKAGSGTWTLSGTNTYTGPTAVNGGTLALGFGAGAANILPASSALTMGGGTLQLTGTGTQTNNGLTTTASTSSRILLDANETLTLGALTAAGAGSSLNFNTVAGGANATTPAVGTGIVVLTGITPGNAINSGFTVSDVGGFGLATVNGLDQVVRQTSGATLLPATGATSATDYRVDNNAGGSAADGSSSLAVTATEATKSFTVDTTTASGVLTLNSGVVLSGNLWHFGGVGANTYQITGSDAGAGLQSLVLNDAINLNNYNPGVVTIASPILANGSNNVNLNGSGTTVFSGNNTYTGKTTVNAGTLKVTGGTSVIGALSVGAAIYQQDSSSSVSSVTLTGTTELSIGTTGTSAFTLNAGTFLVQSATAAAANIGVGGVTTFTQTGGLFSFAPTGANLLLNMGVATTGSATLNLSGGTFQTAANVPAYLGGRVTTDMNISGTALVDVPNLIFNRNLNTAHTATLNLGDGTLGSGTLKVSTITKESAAANNVANFNFNGGTLKAGVSTNAFMAGLTTASVKDGGAIIDSDVFDVTIGQALVHFAGATTDSLTKKGTGKLTLTNANTYTGNTTVSNGTLALSGSGSITTSPNLIVVGGATLDVTAVSGGFTLAANQTLKGNGTVTGPITINGTVSPGASIGTLTLISNLVLNASSTNTFEVDGSTPTNDVIVLGDAVTYGGVLNIVPTGTFTAGQTFTLFSGAGATNVSNFASLVGSPGGGNIFSFTNGVLSVVSTGSPVSTNADLISLVLSPAGTLSPTFASNVLTYAASEAYVNTPTVTVVNADLTATNNLIYNGTTNLLASGVASGPLSLTLGVNNPVVVQVTAQDGLTVKTYTVNVTRQPSLTPVTLTNLVSGSTLTLSWPADHLGYSLQSQTNLRSVGLKTNWVALPGSESLTTTNLPIDKANPTVFYRLVYP